MNEVFKNNPKLEKYYGTSDGEAFYNENDAKNYAKTLEDKTVEAVYNPEFLEVEDSENLSEEEKEMNEFETAKKAEDDKKAKEEAEAQDKIDADKKAQETAEKPVIVDLSKMSKAKLLTYATEQKLTIADPTATNAVLVQEIFNQLPKNKE